jgi:SAM-dependent methyltransferase
MIDPTQRFSTRVADYIRYRPSYPPAVIELLRNTAGLTHGAIAADVGSGTGMLSQLLLDTGATVYGVEPNDAMRAAAETLLHDQPRFVSIAATAENTTLPDHQIDLITAAQAFHWFDRDRTRQEWQRILKPGGSVALIWNDRRPDATPFLRAYESLLRDFGTDYQSVNHRNIDRAVLLSFFRAEFREATFPNAQRFDFEGLKGRLLSSSYVPAADDPRAAPMLQALRSIYEAHQEGGSVVFEYETRVFYGRLDP